MRYVSTRGGVSGLSFCEAVMMGLASDGGLLVPVAIPDISGSLREFRAMDYNDLALRVMSCFIDDIPPADLESLIRRSYATFDDDCVTPLVPVGDMQVMELFHGPTLAFKDIALQFLGHVFEYVLTRDGGRLNILGATSGDTGSAAIAGLRGKQNINIFIMFPHGRVSSLQERQMTTVLDDNVQNLAIEGSFDDCQSILKDLFADLPFKERYQLGAVNSVNWARVLAQVVYYFAAWVQLGAPAAFQVAVPTGNFGNIFAGYIARRMGLPIDKLILATNENDILHRFFTTGRYRRGRVHFTHSPAMDIQAPSNFERYLYYQFAQKADRVIGFMREFLNKGSATVNFNTVNFDDAFATGCATDAETLETIARTFENTGYLPDPHTATGIHVAQSVRDASLPLVCMATAHPAKFDDVIQEALPGLEVSHPALEALKGLPARSTQLPNDREAVKAIIAEHDRKAARAATR